jgi:hypothetical protein
MNFPMHSRVQSTREQNEELQNQLCCLGCWMTHS